MKKTVYIDKGVENRKESGLSELNDDKIIELFYDRNEHAIEATGEKYGAYCNQIAYHILHDVQTSEECVNDTWLNAWNAIPPERPRILRAFLAKITRNLAINRYNAMNAEKRGGGEIDLVLDELSEVVSGGSGPEEEIIASELGQAISSFLRGLPVREADIVIRRYFYGESTGEIAASYGMSPGNVSVMLNRSRKKLKDFLTKEGYIK